MARITKEAGVRRDELLDVTLDLCMGVGFEGMSVEQVTTAAGVAKGTFYHYFTSKQDLLLQLVARFGDALLSYLEDEMSRVDGDGLERMRALMDLSSRWKMERVNGVMAYMPFLYKDENYTLRHRFADAWLARMRPLLLDIIEQGARGGDFSVTDPQATTDILLSTWFDGGRLLVRAMAAPDEAGYADVLVRGAHAMFEAEERILGAPEGSLQVRIDPAIVAGTRASMAQEGVFTAQEVGRPMGRRR